MVVLYPDGSPAGYAQDFITMIDTTPELIFENYGNMSQFGPFTTVFVASGPISSMPTAVPGDFVQSTVAAVLEFPSLDISNFQVTPNRISPSHRM